MSEITDLVQSGAVQVFDVMETSHKLEGEAIKWPLFENWIGSENLLFEFGAG